MHDWVKGLLDVRGAHPDLQTGEEQMLQAGANVVMYVRGNNLQSGCSTSGKDDRVLVLVNKGDRPETIDLPMSNTALADCRNVSHLWGADGSLQIKADTLQVVISPGSAEIAGVN
jgi:glycosidase